MTQPITFPAVELPLVDRLAADYAEHDVLVPVVVEVPAERPKRFVRLVRIGGTPVDILNDRPRIAVEYWDVLGTGAAELASLGRALVNALGPGSVGTVWIDRVRDMGLSYQPDPDTRTPRYVSYHELYVPGAALP